MALVVFRSRAASAILMYSETAQRLLECIGKPLTERGVITIEQLDDALAGLRAAIDLEPAAGPNADDDPLGAHTVSLRQRAFPLLEMLQAARKRGVEVTWGI